jgi:hypothetical protein
MIQAFSTHRHGKKSEAKKIEGLKAMEKTRIMDTGDVRLFTKGEISKRA